MDYVNERWKPCPDFETKYLISDYGRIKSIGTYNTCKTGGLLALQKKHGRNGYMQVRLYDNNRVKTIEVHSLVAKAFVPNPNGFPMVNHIDEDKTNNYYKNLEWCDNRYNIRYSHARAVDVYTKEGVFVETLEALTDASTKYGVPIRNVSRCCKSVCGTAGGFQFRYKGEPFSPKPIKEHRERKYKKHNGLHGRDFYYKPIEEYTTEGFFVTEWRKISSASKEYGIPTTNISKCCKGIILSIQGRVFLYKGSDLTERITKLKNRKHKSKSEYVR